MSDMAMESGIDVNGRFRKFSDEIVAAANADPATGNHVAFLTFYATGGMRPGYEHLMGEIRLGTLEGLATPCLLSALLKAADAGRADQIAEFLSNPEIFGLLKSRALRVATIAVQNAAEKGLADGLVAMLECKDAHGKPHEEARGRFQQALQKAAREGLVAEVLRAVDSDAVPARIRQMALNRLPDARKKMEEKGQVPDWFVGQRVRGLMQLRVRGDRVLDMPEFPTAGRPGWVKREPTGGATPRKAYSR